MILGEFQGHCLIASLSKCDFSFSCPAVDHYCCTWRCSFSRLGHAWL